MWIIANQLATSGTACEDGDVRPVGGRHYREGRVEVCRNQQWGAVCDDQWDERDSAVVCRQLGFSEEGAEAVIHSIQFGTSTLPFFLDDLGCSGSESTILDCLPDHNCGFLEQSYYYEKAGVHCLRKGVNLEYGPNQEKNNTLITVDNISVNNRVLFCSTDREDCCTDEVNIPGNWYLPNGSKIPSTTNTQALQITLGNQTFGLNITNSTELPTGIYHCGMMDKKNITHYLYAGVYPENEGNVTDISVQYDRTSQTITCTSSGGPATDVAWFKDNEGISIVSDEDHYEWSQIITETFNATYENRLRIIDKSSKAAETYTCEVTNPRGSTNESLYIQVCRDLEFRVNNKSNGHGRIVEVCIDDQWHEATSAKVANNSQSPQSDIFIQVDSTSESVIITWSEQSIPSDRTITGYDLSCRTSALSDGQIHEVKVPNVSSNITRIQVNRLLPGTTYECCVSTHILTNTPLNLISSSCATTKTESFQKPSNGLAIGLGTGVSICFVLLIVATVLIGFVINKARWSKQGSTTRVITNTKRVTEEYNLDANPIYNISIQRTASTPRQQGTVTTTAVTAGGDEAVMYEEVSSLHRNKRSTSIRDTPAESQLGTDV